MTTVEEYQLGKMSKIQTETTQEFSHDITLNDTKDETCMLIRADVTTSIKRLNVVCLVLTIAVIIMAVTIGILLSDLKKGEGATEGKVDVLHARVEQIKSETDLKTVGDTSTIDKQSTRLTRLESDFQDLSTTRTRLESDFQDLSTRHTRLEVDFQDLLAALEENNNTISQLESDRTEDRASIHQHTTKIVQLESDRTNDLASIQSHTTRIMDLESDMAKDIVSIQSLNTSIMDLNEGYLKRSSGYAFNAEYLASSNPAVGKTLVFKTVQLNEGNAYSNITGKYTAPMNGSYLFTTTLCFQGGAYSYIHFIADDAQVTYFLGGRGVGDHCTSSTITIFLQKDKEFWLEKGVSSGSIHVQRGYGNTFSGHMINEI